MTTPIDIAINGRFLTRPVSGVERVAVQLVRSLDELADDKGVVKGRHGAYRFRVYTPDQAAAKDHGALFRQIPVLKTQGSLTSKLKGHAWEQIALPMATRGQYLVNLANSCPALRSRQTVYVHDAAIYAVPDAYSWKYRAFYKTLYQVMRVLPPAFLTNSEFSKAEIAKHMAIQTDAISVVVPGADGFDHTARNDELLARLGLKRREFLLAVSSAQQNKNFDGIVRALNHLGSAAPQVAIVGSMSHPSFKKSATESHSHIHHLGRVSDADLAALYESTRGLIYPSFYEGFGLPPVEAIASGTLPIVSRRASLPEVCGPSVLYCDPEKVESIAEAITTLFGLSDDDWKKRQEAAQEHIAHYRWSNGANQLLQHLQQVTSTAGH
jgi:glycosyltransferase involved in cell wall biosynthesis